MAVKTHTWISLWFLLAAPIILWDVGYCFMRPRSMKGGDLHWLWAPYASYQEIDHLYGLPALQSGDGFTNAQSLLNAIETLMNLTYLYLAHVVQWPAATLVGFAAVVMTLSKTILYLAQEYYCGFCAVGHNKAWEFTVWLFPLVLWLVVSSIIVYQFGKDLAESLNIASQQSSKIASSKKQ